MSVYWSSARVPCRRHAESRRGVERHVVVEELAEKRDAGRGRRVVAVVGAELRVRDQPDRSFRERIFRIERPARRAKLEQRLLDGGARFGERRQVEDAGEAIGAGLRHRDVFELRDRSFLRQRPGRRDDRPRADPPQKLPSCDRTGIFLVGIFLLVFHGHTSPDTPRAKN